MRKKAFFILLFISSLILFNCKSNTDEKSLSNEDKLELLNAKIEREPDNAALYYTRANYFLEARNIEKAYADISKAITLDDKKSNYYITLSDILLSTGKVKECSEALEKSIELDNKNEEAFLKLAELNLYLKDYTKTYENLKKVIEINDINAKAYYIRGFAKKEEGDTASAVTALRKCIELEPDYYKAYMELGYLYLIKNNALAADYFSSALNINPQSIDALYALGMFYLQNDKATEALKQFESIVRLDSAYVNALFNIGFIQNEYLKNYNEAIKFYNKALHYEPTYAEAYFEKGLAYENLQDKPNASASYKMALEYKTNYREAIQALNRLDGSHIPLPEETKATTSPRKKQPQVQLMPIE